MDHFNDDKHSGLRVENIYYPFAGKDEWELASFLHSSGLLMRKINDFLKLKLVITNHVYPSAIFHHNFQVKDARVSFSTAKVLCGRMEMLPSIPDWKSKKISITGYPTSELMYLFYHDALDCIKYVSGNPLFANHMDFSPTRLYQDMEQTICLYSEWMTGDATWDMQVRFIPCAARYF